MATQKNIGELLADLMEAEGMTAEKLASQTNIPSRFIIAMREGELDKLPAEPYVRGYLKKIADVLKADEGTLINAYKESKRVARLGHVAGETDKLPSNQFARVPMKKSWFVVPILILILIGSIFLRFNQVFGVPELNLELPSSISTESLLLSGSVTPGDKLTLNDEIVYTDDSGHFEETILLKPGLNTLQFKVKRFLGKESTIIKEIIYEEPESGTSITPKGETTPPAPIKNIQ